MLIQAQENFSKIEKAIAMRMLWLVFERVPHPEAVCYAASEEDARLAETLLSSPRTERLKYAEQLRNYLREQEPLPPFERPGVACRAGAGLYRVISWRFAKWLANTLPAEGTPLERVRGRIRDWLAGGERGEGTEQQICHPLQS